MMDRVDGRVEARKTPLGYLPYAKDIDRYALACPSLVLFPF